MREDVYHAEKQEQKKALQKVYFFSVLQLLKNECQSCKTGINCCLTSQPCLNNGICILLPNKNTRFTCQCLDGYTGHRCTKKAKSCRAFHRGNHEAGKFKIFDNNDNIYTVYCSFDANMTWTLVQSYKYSHKDEHNLPIYKNEPIHQNTFSWDNYRLSRARMKTIHEDSNRKWRFTCNFDTDGAVYTDYVRANHEHIPMLSFTSKSDDGACKTVEFINIRGTECNNCTALVAHKDNWPLHIDSYYTNKRCSNNFSGSESCNRKGEDNFGFYHCRNQQHRCSATEESTTQLWFGGE